MQLVSQQQIAGIGTKKKADGTPVTVRTDDMVSRAELDAVKEQVRVLTERLDALTKQA